MTLTVDISSIEARFALSLAAIGVAAHVLTHAIVTNASQALAAVVDVDVTTVVAVFGDAMAIVGTVVPVLAAIAAFAVAWVGRPLWHVAAWFVAAGVVYMVGWIFLGAVTGGEGVFLPSMGLAYFHEFTTPALLAALVGHLLRGVDSLSPAPTT